MLLPRKCAWRTCGKEFTPQKQSDKYCPPPRKCRALATRQTKRKWWNRNRATVGRAQATCKGCAQPFKIRRPRQMYCDKCGGGK